MWSVELHAGDIRSKWHERNTENVTSHLQADDEINLTYRKITRILIYIYIYNWIYHVLTITTSGVFFCSDHVHRCRADGLLTWPVVNNRFRSLNALTLLINNSGWCFVCGSWSVNWSCVAWCASCPSQQSANTPHCAVSLKVWWISLWCLKTLLLATQSASFMREAFVFVLFLYNAWAVLLDLNKHCSVWKTCDTIPSVRRWRWSIIWNMERGYFHPRYFNG